MKRNGASLVEVLMSIMVMGVGVLSVITLFPASFLRTMQATNITHATVLRFNADALIDLDRTNRIHVYPFWQPGKVYSSATPDIVLSGANPGPGNNRRFVCTTAGWCPNLKYFKRGHSTSREIFNKTSIARKVYGA